MATKFKMGQVRQAVANLVNALEEYDAAKAAESGEAVDGAGSGLGAKTLEETDQPVKQDDPPEFNGKPANPVTNGNQLVGAEDAAPAGIHNPSNGRTRVVQVFDTPRNPSKTLKARQPSTADAWLNSMQDKFAADSKAASDALFTSGKK